MNQQIRETVKGVIRERGLTQQQLADEMGIARTHLNQMLSGKLGQVPPRWALLADALDLEIVIQPKQR